MPLFDANINNHVENHLNMEELREDGGGVNGSHTDSLLGPIWNYNSIVEKPPGTNN